MTAPDESQMAHCRPTGGDMTDLPTIARPNGKPYRPRAVVAHAVVDDGELLSGVVVLGTHDVGRAQALADSYVQWQLDVGYRAATPFPGWYRDAFECGERRWVSDEEHGRAGVWFREIVEATR